LASTTVADVDIASGGPCLDVRFDFHGCFPFLIISKLIVRPRFRLTSMAADAELSGASRLDVGLDLKATSYSLIVVARKFPGLDVRFDFHICVFLS
jgi:hypothetical protein